MRYFFILGNTPILSSAEIFAVLERQGISSKCISISDEVLLLEMGASFDPKALMTTLGGTVKIGRLLPPDKTTEQWVRDRKTDGRIVVGVSVYKAADGVANAKCDETLRMVRGEVLGAKRILKEEGRTLRLVTGRDRALPSVALVTEHILERGGELVALLSHKGVERGETLAVQAFQEYRKRDMGRPSRDALRGMLPQKVAQMMVNLTGVKNGGVICDPFCGSGTVLSEAALLGYRVVGSDISREAIEDTRKNLDWIKNDSRFTIHDPRLFVSDVRDLSKYLALASVDAIVTEPYLGPPLTGKESSVLLGKVRRDVQALVTDAFGSFRDVLRPDGRVVIVLLVLGEELLPIDPIEKLGWRLVNNNIPRCPPAGGSSDDQNGLTSRNTILYSRDDQHLAREITIWTRSK